MSNLLTVLVACGALSAILVLAMRVFAPARARKRCLAHLSHARHLMANGIYAPDAHGSPGPAELLGEVFRLQMRYDLSSKEVGLADDDELDRLIDEVIANQGPKTSKGSRAHGEPTMEEPYAADDGRPTVPDAIGTPAPASPERAGSNADDVDEILTSALTLASQPPEPDGC